MIGRFTDPEMFFHTVRSMPRYFREYSMEDLLDEAMGELNDQVRLYREGATVDEGWTFEYEGETLVFGDPLHYRESFEDDIITGYLANCEVNQGDTVVDIGAFPGEFAFYVSHQVGEKMGCAWRQS